MKIILLYIFTVRCFYVLSSTPTLQSKCNNLDIICQYTEHWNVKYEFTMSEVLPRCNIVAYGWYLLDRRNEVDTYVTEKDKNAVRTLVECQKTVYTILGCNRPDCGLWADFLNPIDDTTYNQIVGPLKQYLIDFSLSGILIHMPPIYDESLKNPTESIVNFITDLKNSINNLKVGLVLNGLDYENFSNATIFDFTKTNLILDHYLIDLTSTNSCNENTRQCSMNPISSTNPNITSLQQMTDGVSCSTMDKCKVIARLQVGVYIPKSIERPYQVKTSYSEYCSSTDITNSSNWCTDSSQTLYSQGQFCTQYYCGIMLWGLETDDFENECGCGKYSISNLIMDGWQGQPMKDCQKLDTF